MHLSPRVKFGLLLGGIFLIVWAWISLIFSLGNGGESSEGDDFATNIQQAIPEVIEGTNEQLGETNATNTGNDSPTIASAANRDRNATVAQKPGSSITILVPPIIDKKSREIIHRAINTKSQQATRMLYYPTRDLYARAVRDSMSEGNSDDVVLIPSIWYESFVDTALQFRLQETMKSLFHPMTIAWFFNEQITVVPFALDPLVIGAHERLAEPVSVASLVAQRNILSSFFGFAVAQRQGETTRGTVASNALVHNALVTAATTGAKRRVSFLLLGSEIVPGSSLCDGLLSRCAFSEKLVTTTIAPLSVFSPITPPPYLYNVPLGTDIYPVVGRGFVIPSTSDNQAAAAQRLASYLELSANGELIYPPYLLSASIRTLQRQRIEERYEAMQAFFNAQSLLVGGMNDPSYATFGLIDNYQRGEISLDLLLQAIGDRL